MAIGDLVGRLLGRTRSGDRLTVYECEACEATFESAKTPERASCPECLSRTVTKVGTTDSYSSSREASGDGSDQREQGR